MWQLCPKCKGDSNDCRICKGKGIIGELSGKPPIDDLTHKEAGQWRQAHPDTGNPLLPPRGQVYS